MISITDDEQFINSLQIGENIGSFVVVPLTFVNLKCLHIEFLPHAASFGVSFDVFFSCSFVVALVVEAYLCIERLSTSCWLHKDSLSHPK